MQQTGLDSWIRQKFVNRYTVYANTIPSILPPGAEPDMNPGPSERAWAWVIECESENVQDEVVDRCRAQRIACRPEVSRKAGWWVNVLDGGSRKESFTLGVVWNVLRVTVALSLFAGCSLAGALGALCKGDLAGAMRAIVEFTRIALMRAAVCAAVFVAWSHATATEIDLTQAPLDIVLPAWGDSGEEAAPGGADLFGNISQEIEEPVLSPAIEDDTAYWVIRRVATSPEGAESLPFDKHDKIKVEIFGDDIVVTRGSSTVRYRIHDRSPMRDWTSLSTVPVAAMKASRVAVGGGIEQVYLAGAGVTIISPVGATSGVVTTYAACAARIETTTASVGSR